MSFLRSSSDIRFPQNSIPIGFGLTNQIWGDWTPNSNSPPLKAPTWLFSRKRKFDQLVSWQLNSYWFRANQSDFKAIGPQIRTHRPRKPLVTCLLCAHKVLLSSSPILTNAAIWLFRHTGGPFAGGGPMFFRQKVVVDLLLDERMIPAKFGCTGSYKD